MTIESDDLASGDVSSGALLQTHFFRRSSSDAIFRRILPDAFKLQMNSFALDLFNPGLAKDKQLFLYLQQMQNTSQLQVVVQNCFE